MRVRGASVITARLQLLSPRTHLFIRLLPPLASRGERRIRISAKAWRLERPRMPALGAAAKGWRPTLAAAAAAAEGRGGGVVGSWWDDVNGSEERQRELFHTLCGCYTVLSFFALVQLCRIQLRVPEYGWTTQKLFHLLNFIVNGLRAVSFGLYHGLFLLQSKALEMALLDLPGLLFFSTYTLLVLFWAEIYHQAKSLPINHLRPAYLGINAAIYSIQILIWICLQVDTEPIVIEAAKLFFSVVSFFAVLGFVIYGGRLFLMLRRFPIESKGRRKKLNEVGLVSTICCCCFLTRCIIVTLSALYKDADLDVLDHPVLNFTYYMLVEILPSAFVLYILRKLPPKRVSERYQPIR